MDLHIDAAEAQLLGRILTNYLSDLRMEIADTDLPELRDRLKRDEAIATGVIARLSKLASNPT
jgi:hypothetical protein